MEGSIQEDTDGVGRRMRGRRMSGRMEFMVVELRVEKRWRKGAEGS